MNLSTGLFWAALSTLSWSLFDLSRKKISSQVPLVAASVLLVLLQIPAYILWTLSSQTPLPFHSMILWQVEYLIPFASSAVLNALAVALFLVSVSWVPLSLAIPVLSITPAIAGLGATLILGEALSSAQWIGLVLIIVAALALGFWAAPRADSLGSNRIRWGMALMAVVAICFAIIPVLDKQCLKVGVPAPFHAFLQTIVVALLLTLGFASAGARKGLGQLGRAPLRLWLGAAVFSSLAFATQLKSLELMHVGLFEAVKRGGGLLLALALGVWFLGEKVRPAQLACAAALLLGLLILLSQS